MKIDFKAKSLVKPLHKQGITLVIQLHNGQLLTLVGATIRATDSHVLIIPSNNRTKDGLIHFIVCAKFMSTVGFIDNGRLCIFVGLKIKEAGDDFKGNEINAYFSYTRYSEVASEQDIKTINKKEAIAV